MYPNKNVASGLSEDDIVTCELYYIISIQIYDGSSLDEVKMDVNAPLHSAQRWENVGYMCYVIPMSNSSKYALTWYTMVVVYIIIPFPVEVKLWQTQYMYGTIG